LRSAHDETYHGARRYTTGEMRAKLKGAGFTIKKLSYINCFIFPAVASWRIGRRIAGVAEGSDVGPVPAWLNAIMGALYCFEASLLARVNLPIGTSIIALAQKA
jgi:hypothetical protein